MQELISEGSYFSDEEMKERDEKLHYQMIGEILFIVLDFSGWWICFDM